MSSGDPVIGQECPRCHQEEVVYNGNYWCDHCTWVMPENGKHNDRIIKAYLIQKFLEYQADGDQQGMDHIGFYLTKYADKP